MNMLELRRVSKVYGQGAAEVHALDRVTLSVDEGAMVAVMGPSGSGKSTLLTIAGSLEEPAEGEVLVRGAALAGMSRNDKARLRRRTIGYVFQDYNLLPGLTAAENVSLPLELDGLPARKARAAGLAALAELGLAGDSASTSHYSCSDSPALLTPLAEVVGPADRKLNREALISILTAIRDDVPLPPVVVFREPGASTATLLDGVHRWRASLALGFSSIPCTQPSREDAELCYRYARP